MRKTLCKFLAFALSAAVTAGIVPAAAAEAEAVEESGAKTDGRLVVYPVPSSGVDLVSLYTVRARPAGAGDDAWVDLPVYSVRVVSSNSAYTGMVYFDCDCEVELEVTCNSDIDFIDLGLDPTEEDIGEENMPDVSYNPAGGTFKSEFKTAIYPKSVGTELNYEKGGNVITFTVNPNDRLVLDPNGDTRHSLHIWAGEIMELPTVEELEAEGKSVTVVDAAAGDTMQSSYDTDVVYVKPGYYDTGFNFKDNQTMYMEGGAVVHSTISLDDTTNARLIGRGMIYRPQYAAVSVNDAKNAYVCGTMSLNYTWAGNGGYGVNISNAKNVTIKNVKSIGMGRWGDCLDIFCSEDVAIEDCFFRGNDDCIAIYGPRGNGGYWGDTGNVRNIKVTGCVLMPDLARPIHFATHGDSSSPNGGRVIDNCHFKDCDILTYNKYAWRWDSGTPKRMPQPIRMDVSEGNTVSNVYFEDIRIQDYMANELVEMFLNTQDRYGTYTHPGKGINNIYFKDITYENPDDSFTSRIEGWSTSDGTDGFTQNITFENVKINGKVAESMSDIHAGVGSNVKNVKFTKSGESKFIYNPLSTPADIWPTFYNYAGTDKASASSEISKDGSDPANVLDDDADTVWYSETAESDPVYYSITDYPDTPGKLEGGGLTIDMGAQHHIRNIRITWEDPMLVHSYKVYVSKDGENWGAGHADERHGSLGDGPVNSGARADYNERVKTIWIANQDDPEDPNAPVENCVGRYVKIVPMQGYALDIVKVEVRGDEEP